jgi:integrase
VAINRLTGPYCPVQALLTWIEAAGIEAGPIFRRVRQRGGIPPDAEATPLSGRSVRRTIAGAADAADLNGDFAGHSLRRGHLTEAALRGARLVDMQRQARHADPATTTGYIDDAQRMQRSTSSNLGL